MTLLIVIGLNYLYCCYGGAHQLKTVFDDNGYRLGCQVYHDLPTRAEDWIWMARIVRYDAIINHNSIIKKKKHFYVRK